ncbi:MAG: DMT family transporter [Candidatus Dormibacteria bacterium]
MAVTDLELLEPTAAAPVAGPSPAVAAAVGALCISSSAVLVELAGTPAVTTAFFRCLLAVPFLVPVAVWERRRLGSPRRRAHLFAAIAGAFFAADLVLWNHAIDDVGAGIATVLGNLQVIVVTAAAWLLYRERPGRTVLVVLPAVIGGAVLVSGLAGRPSFAADPAGGIIFGSGTSLAYAGFLLTLRSAAARPHVATPLLVATASAAIVSALLGLLVGGFEAWPGVGPFLWLLLLAVTSQTVGWLLITSSLPHLTRAVSSLILLLQPVAALGLAALVRGEVPTALQLVGATLICGGVLVVARSARRPQPAR